MTTAGPIPTRADLDDMLLLACTVPLAYMIPGYEEGILWHKQQNSVCIDRTSDMERRQHGRLEVLGTER